MVRVFYAVAVSTNQINNKSGVAHLATNDWLCWSESIRFNHSSGRARTELHVFPLPWQ